MRAWERSKFIVMSCRGLFLFLDLLLFYHHCLAEQQLCLSASGCECFGEDFSINFTRAFSYPISINDTNNSKFYYVISPCEAISTCGSSEHVTADSAVCQINQNTTGILSTSCGSKSDVTWIIDSPTSFTVIYENGDLAYNNFSRNTVLQISIDDSIRRSSIEFLGEKNDHRRMTITYNFKVILTPRAASGGTDSSGVTISPGAIVGIVISASIILVLLVMSLYCIVGALVNRAKGAKVVPLAASCYCRHCQYKLISTDGNYHKIQD